MNAYSYGTSRPSGSPYRESPRRKYRAKEETFKGNRKSEASPQWHGKLTKQSTLKVRGQLTNAYNPVSLNEYITYKYPHGKTLTQPTLVPNLEGKIYHLKLKLQCEVDFNQRICVVGSIPQLGNWQDVLCHMRWTEGHVWVLDEAIQTQQPHFTYKYVLMEDDEILKWESGIDRIADLELLPDLTKKTSDFVKKQQQMLVEKVQHLENKIHLVNQIKNVVINDEWETYSINFTVFQPFEDNIFDMRLEGNREELDLKVMKKAEKVSDWMDFKYGQKIKPYDITVKMRQTP